MAYHRMDTYQKKTLIGCGFAAAIVVAPFLALLINVEFGLGVLVAALGVTAYAVIERLSGADPTEARRLKALLVVNGVFLILSVAALGVMLFD